MQPKFKMAQSMVEWWERFWGQVEQGGDTPLGGVICVIEWKLEIQFNLVTSQSHSGSTNFHSPQQRIGIQFLPILTSVWCRRCFYVSCSDRCLELSHVVCASLIANDSECFCMCLFAICTFSMVRCPCTPPPTLNIPFSSFHNNI